MTKRLGRLNDPHYLAAVSYWVLSRTLRVQVHKVLTARLSPDAASDIPLPSGYRFHALNELDRLLQLEPELEEQLDEQSGLPCRSMLERGDRIYAITDSGRVACQLNMRRGPLTVDSPSDLRFDLQDNALFLNYLYTHEEHRGRGLAVRLIRLASADAARSRWERCFCHVRATNHASLSAFRRCGWKEAARILSTRSGRFLGAPGCRSAGIRITEINDVEASA